MKNLKYATHKTIKYYGAPSTVLFRSRCYVAVAVVIVDVVVAIVAVAVVVAAYI